jgi:hypothetical protein
MSDSDDIAQRRARLRALRERYRSDEESDQDDGQSMETTSAMSAEPDRPAVSGGGQEGRPLLERLRRYLIGPDGNVDEQHLQQVIQFLRRRAQDPNGPGRARAQRLLQFLEGQGAGRDRQRLMRLLRGRGVGRRGGGPPAGAGNLQPSSTQTEDHERLIRLEEAVERLDRITQALAAHLDRPHRARGNPDESPGRGARPGSSQGGPDEEWFIDFLEEV